MQTKQCRKCGKEKKYSDFYVNRSNHDKLNKECRDCVYTPRKKLFSGVIRIFTQESYTPKVYEYANRNERFELLRRARQFHDKMIRYEISPKIYA